MTTLEKITAYLRVIASGTPSETQRIAQQWLDHHANTPSAQDSLYSLIVNLTNIRRD